MMNVSVRRGVTNRKALSQTHTHMRAIIELSLSSNAVLQSIQSFQGQSDPPNLCSVQQSGWVGVGGEVRSCSFCLLRGDGYSSQISCARTHYTHTHQQPTLSRLQLQEGIQDHLIDMDTLPPTCQHSKLGCNYTLSPPGDATGARFLVSLPPSVCTKVQIKSPVSIDPTNFARCCLTTKINNQSLFPNLLFFLNNFLFLHNFHKRLYQVLHED